MTPAGDPVCICCVFAPMSAPDYPDLAVIFAPFHRLQVNETVVLRPTLFELRSVVDVSQVKYKIKKEKQARKDRAAAREGKADADQASQPSQSGENLKGGIISAGAESTDTRKRKKISVRRGKFSSERCKKRSKELRQAARQKQVLEATNVAK